MEIFDRLLKLEETIYKLTKAYVKNKSIDLKALLEEQKSKETRLLNSLSYEDMVKLETLYRKKYGLCFDKFFVLEIVDNPYFETCLLSLYLKLREIYSFYQEQEFSHFSKAEINSFLNVPYYRQYVKDYQEKLVFYKKVFQNYLHEKDKISFDDIYLLNSLSGEKKETLDEKHIEKYISDAFKEVRLAVLKDETKMLEKERSDIIKALLEIVPVNKRSAFLAKARQDLEKDSSKEELEVIFPYDASMNFEVQFHDLMNLERKILTVYKEIIKCQTKEDINKMCFTLATYLDEEKRMIGSIKNFSDFLFYLEKSHLFQEDFLPCYFFLNEQYRDDCLCIDRLFNYDLSLAKEPDEEEEINNLFLADDEDICLDSLEEKQKVMLDFMLGKISKEDLISAIDKQNFVEEEHVEEKIWAFFENLKQRFFNILYLTDDKDMALLYAFTDSYITERLLKNSFNGTDLFLEKERPYFSEEEKSFYLSEVQDYILELEERYPKWQEYTDIYLDCCFDYLGLKKNTLERKYGTIKKHKKEDKDE